MGSKLERDIGVQQVRYDVKVGSWLINSAEDPRTELVNLETTACLFTPSGHCRIVMYSKPTSSPGLLEQTTQAAAGAVSLVSGESQEDTFSVEARGKKVKSGNAISIGLTVGDVSETAITAEVTAILSTLGVTSIEGRTGMQKLARARLNQVYQNQTLRQIVSDLADQTGVDVGDIETGQTYLYFVVHESKTTLKHLQELAMREGMDLYFNTDNKLTMKVFNKTSADHTFHYGIDILDLQVDRHQPTSEHLPVYGESPSSNQGSDTWHWLVKDFKPFRSDVGKGSERLGIADGAVRTKDAADSLAKSKLGTMKDQATVGQLKILGNPTVQLGDAIEIKGVPKPELNGLFKVVSVRHRYSKQRGFVTTVGFTGQGGAAKAGGLLGQAAGQLAGALEL